MHNKLHDMDSRAASAAASSVSDDAAASMLAARRAEAWARAGFGDATAARTSGNAQRDLAAQQTETAFEKAMQASLEDTSAAPRHIEAQPLCSNVYCSSAAASASATLGACAACWKEVAGEHGGRMPGAGAAKALIQYYYKVRGELGTRHHGCCGTPSTPANGQALPSR